MKSEVNLSGGAVQLILAGGGALLAYGLSAFLTSMINDFRYEPVMGEHLGGTTSSAHASVASLPIVIAANTAPAPQEVTNIADDMIEAAFKIPEPEVEEAPQKPTLTPAAMFSLLYRPSVGGLAGNGLFINGRFVRVGEELNFMPVRMGDGSVIYPRVASVSRKAVSFAIGEEAVSVPVSFY